MKDYSPKRRTALVLAGSGSSGAYHAGVLKALDESGVKVDVIVGSGVGAVSAALGAIAAGPQLYGPEGFWEGVSFHGFYRLRPVVRLALVLLGASFGVFALPVVAALLGGLLFPVVLLADLALPGIHLRLVPEGWSPAAFRTPYLASLSLPIFLLALVVVLHVLKLLLRDRRRLPEAFESVLDPTPVRRRLLDALWEAARGAASAASRGDEVELGKRYVALLAENFGQPGFRELVLRAADLEAGGVLPFVVLQDRYRQAFTTLARGAGGRARDGSLLAVDLRAPGNDTLFFDAVLTGVLPLFASPVRRVAFPRTGLFGGETHRLTDGTLVAGCGISEAIAAGAEQVIVVSAVPERSTALPRRRGLRALVDGVIATLERQGVEEDLKGAERVNRMVETLGHKTEDGGRAWQDPATGRLFRSVSIYVVRPERRSLGPLELDGAQDPSTEVLETPRDLLELGHRDAYRMFLEPVVGAAPEPRKPAAGEEEPRSIGL